MPGPLTGVFKVIRKVNMTRKPNRKTKRYSRPRFLKSVRRDKRHPEFGLKESAMRLTLEASPIVRQARLARQNGTTLSVNSTTSSTPTSWA